MEEKLEKNDARLRRSFSVEKAAVQGRMALIAWSIGKRANNKSGGSELRKQ